MHRGPSASPRVSMSSDWMTPVHQTLPSRTSRARGEERSALRTLGIDSGNQSPAAILHGCRQRGSERRAVSEARQRRVEELRQQRDALMARLARDDDADARDDADSPGAAILAMVDTFGKLCQARRAEAAATAEIGVLQQRLKAARDRRQRVAADVEEAARECEAVSRDADAVAAERAALLVEVGLPHDFSGDADEAAAWLNAEIKSAERKVQDATAELAEDPYAAAEDAERRAVAAEEHAGRAALDAEAATGLRAILSDAAVIAPPGSPTAEARQEETRTLTAEMEAARVETSDLERRVSAAQAELVRLSREPLADMGLGASAEPRTEDDLATLEQRADELRHRVQELSAELEERPTREQSGLGQLEKQVVSLSGAVASAREQLADAASGNLAETARSYELSLAEAQRALEETLDDNAALEAEVVELEAELDGIRSDRTEHERRQRELQAEIELLEACDDDAAGQVEQAHAEELAALEEEIAALAQEESQLRAAVAGAEAAMLQRQAAEDAAREKQSGAAAGGVLGFLSRVFTF